MGLREANAGVEAPGESERLGSVELLALSLGALGAIPAGVGAAHLADQGGWAILWWAVTLLAAAAGVWAGWVGWIAGTLSRRLLTLLESVLVALTATGITMWLTTSLPHVPETEYPVPPSALARVVVTALSAGGLGLVLLPFTWRSGGQPWRRREKTGALARIELALLVVGMWPAIGAGSSLIGDIYPVRSLASEWYEGEHADTLGMLFRGSPALVIGVGVAFLVCVAVSGIVHLARPNAVGTLTARGIRGVGLTVASGTVVLWVLPTLLAWSGGFATLADAPWHVLVGTACAVGGLLVAITRGVVHYAARAEYPRY